MFEYLLLVIIKNTNDGSSGYLYQCVVLQHLIPGTIQFSLLQTLFICFEQLNSTFRTPNKILRTLTSNIDVGAGFLITHTYVMLRYIVVHVLYGGRHSSTSEYTVKKDFLLYMDIPNSILLSLIAASYFFVIARMLRNRRQVSALEDLTELQILQKKKASLRKRKNIVTLSCIVVVAVCAILPRSVYGMYLQQNDELQNGTSTVIAFTNNLLLLNPL